MNLNLTNTFQIYVKKKKKSLSPTKCTKAHWKISKQTWQINYLLFFYFIKPELLSDHLAFV